MFTGRSSSVPNGSELTDEYIAGMDLRSATEQMSQLADDIRATLESALESSRPRSTFGQRPQENREAQIIEAISHSLDSARKIQNGEKSGEANGFVRAAFEGLDELRARHAQIEERKRDLLRQMGGGDPEKVIFSLDAPSYFIDASGDREKIEDDLGYKDLHRQWQKSLRILGHLEGILLSSHRDPKGYFKILDLDPARIKRQSDRRNFSGLIGSKLNLYQQEAQRLEGHEGSASGKLQAWKNYQLAREASKALLSAHPGEPLRVFSPNVTALSMIKGEDPLGNRALFTALDFDASLRLSNTIGLNDLSFSFFTSELTPGNILKGVYSLDDLRSVVKAVVLQRKEDHKCLVKIQEYSRRAGESPSVLENLESQLDALAHVLDWSVGLESLLCRAARHNKRMGADISPLHLVELHKERFKWVEGHESYTLQSFEAYYSELVGKDPYPGKGDGDNEDQVEQILENWERERQRDSKIAIYLNELAREEARVKPQGLEDPRSFSNPKLREALAVKLKRLKADHEKELREVSRLKAEEGKRREIELAEAKRTQEEERRRREDEQRRYEEDKARWAAGVFTQSELDWQRRCQERLDEERYGPSRPLAE